MIIDNYFKHLLGQLMAKYELSLKKSLQKLYMKGRSKPEILEIFTSDEVNYIL